MTLVFWSAGCASLHRVGVGDLPGIPEESGPEIREFVLRSSETGVDLGEAAKIAKVASNSRAVREAADGLETLWSLISFGPTTGKAVFTSDYPEELRTQLQAQCPGGEILGLRSVRETMKYPVVSGEIVNLRGFCLVKGN